MVIGLCASMIDPQTDPAGINCIAPLAELGFDYIELSLAHLTAASDDEFAKAVELLGNTGLPCRACNNFFPASVRVTGPQAELRLSVAHAEAALKRARALGASIVVFGSSSAKNLPEGFPVEKARAQVIDLLKHIGPLAGSMGITLVIEPISRPESNWMLTAADGLRLMGEVNDPHVRLLVDYYHLRTENEPDDVLLSAGSDLRHLHTGQPGDRLFQRSADPAFDSFVQKLKAIGYAGGISIEATPENFLDDARASLAWLRNALGDSSRPSTPSTR